MATSTLTIPDGVELSINGKPYSGILTVDTDCPATVPPSSKVISPATANDIRRIIGTHPNSGGTKGGRRKLDL